ncbi:MAG: hypothetical protein OHK0021_03970 [Bryobacter sp.]
MAEFTGERLVPGKVDTDLWNEHISRYHFAARLCRHKTVLDLGCGLGYGAAELARTAKSVTGVDRDSETIEEATQTYRLPNLSFRTAPVEELPFAEASFEIGVCFEVIEHLDNYRLLLQEARRVIHPQGAFVVSTPNKAYYEESRRLAGPNPFHTREFSYEEFQAALQEYFPYQTFFVQNHTAAILFLPTHAPGSPELRLELEAAEVESAHFFLAVCSSQPLMGAPTYVYVPQSANVLAEREKHIQRLEGELRQKDSWLHDLEARHAGLVEQHQDTVVELESKNKWALEQNARLDHAREVLQRLEAELANTHAESQKQAEAYEERLRSLDAELAGTAAWAKETEQRLNQEMRVLAEHTQRLDEEIAKASEQLSNYQAKVDELDALLVERTTWAQSLEQERSRLEAQLAGYAASRWTKLGRSLGLGPKNA